MIEDDEYCDGGDTHLCGSCDEYTGTEQFDIELRQWFCETCWIPGENVSEE